LREGTVTTTAVLARHFTRQTQVLKDFGFPWPSSLNCSKFPIRKQALDD
jgi:hypothetical protein